MLRATAAAILAVALAAPAAAADPKPRTHPDADFVVYVADGLIVRPISLAATVVGTGFYFATLPFAFAARDTSTFDVLVAQPAAYTFTRCFGCSAGEIAP